MSKLAQIPLESRIFVPCMLSNLLSLISNQINVSAKKLNEQVIWL